MKKIIAIGGGEIGYANVKNEINNWVSDECEVEIYSTGRQVIIKRKE